MLHAMFTEEHRHDLRRFLVWLSCNSAVLEERSVRVLDYSRGDRGTINVLFMCPNCGHVHVSPRHKESRLLHAA